MENERKKFRAGDVVYIESLDEKWLLAADERDDKVVCQGWPESLISAIECRLVKAATDEERLEALRSVSKSCADQMRGRWAAMDLEKT